MRLRVVIGAGVLASMALAGGVATGIASQDDGPRAPIPRVCWFSDYENAKLSNRCEYHSGEQRWYMDLDGKTVPADRQKLPPANLCLYFHGTKCPERDR